MTILAFIELIQNSSTLGLVVDVGESVNCLVDPPELGHSLSQLRWSITDTKRSHDGGDEERISQLPSYIIRGTPERPAAHRLELNWAFLASQAVSATVPFHRQACLRMLEPTACSINRAKELAREATLLS